MDAEEKGAEDIIHAEEIEQEKQIGAHHGKLLRFNKFSFACACLASTTSILLGYDIGVMSGAVLFMKDDLNLSSTQQEILIGSLNICSLFGSLAAGKTSDRIGRKYTIVLASATFLIGAVLMGLAPSYPFLMAGRIVAGIGVGYSLMIAPVYTAELSPACSRGFLSSLPEVFINVGILLGYIFNYAFAGLPMHINWRLMLGVAGVPAIAVGLGVLAMPESPRWLVMRGRKEDAKRVLMRTSNNEQEADLRLTEIVESMTNMDTSNGHDKGKGVWRELLVRPSKAVRKMLMAAIGINFFMQASGNDAVVYYCPAVFKAAGIQNKKDLVLVTVIMGFVKTLFVLISALFLDRFGRRPLLLLGSTGISVSLAVLGLGSKILEKSRAKWAIVMCVVAVCADVASFSIGLGPIAWVYTSEIFPTRLRAQGASIAISVNRVVSGAVSMSFLSLSRAISFGGTFFLFAGISAVGLVFFYVFLPETKGKSLEELAHIFEEKQEERG